MSGPNTFRVRTLITRIIDGMMVAEGAPVIGVVLAAPDATSGLMPVFVTLN